MESFCTPPQSEMINLAHYENSSSGIAMEDNDEDGDTADHV